MIFQPFSILSSSIKRISFGWFSSSDENLFEIFSSLWNSITDWFKFFLHWKLFAGSFVSFVWRANACNHNLWGDIIFTWIEENLKTLFCLHIYVFSIFSFSSTHKQFCSPTSRSHAKRWNRSKIETEIFHSLISLQSKIKKSSIRSFVVDFFYFKRWKITFNL